MSTQVIPGNNSITVSESSVTITKNVSVTGNVIATGTHRLSGYTVATLPAGVQGDMVFVTDALAPAFLTIIVGGGATVTPVFYNGTNWIGF